MNIWMSGFVADFRAPPTPEVADRQIIALNAQLKADYGASTCAALYTPSGVPVVEAGMMLASPTVQTSDPTTPIDDISIALIGPVAALLLENVTGVPFHFDSLIVTYADGSQKTIAYTSDIFDYGSSWYRMNPALMPGFAVTVDVDSKNATKVTLHNPSLDCPLPPEHGPFSCSATTLKVFGLQTGNGLDP